MGDDTSKPIELLPYDPAWAQQFADERRRVEAALGSLIGAVEHIGSTAIPGLSAKPIIDLMVAVQSLDAAPRCYEPLARLGYDYIQRYEAVIPHRRFFIRQVGTVRTHHLHMVEQDSPFWVEHLLFRDYLRAHPAAADAYEHLKRDLAAKFDKSREQYSDGKTEFVAMILERARKGQPFA